VREVFIAGVGQTAVTKEREVRGRYLGAAAVQAALTDAGIAQADVGALYVGNMLSGILANQQQLGGLIADYTGLTGIEAVAIEAACASGSIATLAAMAEIECGRYDCVLVLGAEHDVLVPPSQAEQIARAYGTEAEIFPEMGHAMMLEADWKTVADRVIEWLRGLRAQ